MKNQVYFLRSLEAGVEIERWTHTLVYPSVHKKIQTKKLNILVLFFWGGEEGEGGHYKKNQIKQTQETQEKDSS